MLTGQLSSAKCKVSLYLPFILRDAMVFLHTTNFHETCRDIITSNYAVSDRAMNPKVIREKRKVLDGLRQTSL